MGPKSGKLYFSQPEELFKHMSSEMSSARSLEKDFLVYVPKTPWYDDNKVYDMLKEGYEHMAHINLNLSESGFEQDVCCLEDYEIILRDDADGC